MTTLHKALGLVKQLEQELLAVQTRAQEEQDAPVLGYLRKAAEGLVEEACRRGTAVPWLDVAEGFAGMVVEAARRRVSGDSERQKLIAAFVLLGRARTRSGDNAVATWERMQRKLNRLRGALRHKRGLTVQLVAGDVVFNLNKEASP